MRTNASFNHLGLLPRTNDAAHFPATRLAKSGLDAVERVRVPEE